jgi:formylglycine-generating enzyme required for sulfatase activity
MERIRLHAIPLTSFLCLMIYVSIASTQAQTSSTANRVQQSTVELPREFTNSLGMKLVHIPAGSFRMGSPPKESDLSNRERQHEVTISYDFYLGATEVTQSQFKRIMGWNPAIKSGADPDIDTSSHPIETVSWEEAVEFCKKFSELPEEKLAARKYRLPTEAEWEYACRAGSETAYSFGESTQRLGEYAWYMDNANRRSHPVGAKQPNAWGLYDMHGNVWEWCSDRFGEYPKDAATDPQGPNEGSLYVIRGGGWNEVSTHCRSAMRTRQLSWLPCRDESDTPGKRRMSSN